jgi:hypothetical protein
VKKGSSSLQASTARIRLPGSSGPRGAEGGPSTPPSPAGSHFSLTKAPTDMAVVNELRVARERWIDAEMGRLRNSDVASPETRCLMSDPARVEQGLCLGLIPAKRVRIGASFCSQECHADYRRIRRFWGSLRSCRLCGRPTRKSRLPRAVPSAHTPSSQPGDSANLSTNDVQSES